MGNLRVLNSAGVNDPAETMTSSGPTTGRAIDLFVTQPQIQGMIQNSAQISLNTAQVSLATQAISEIQAGAPPELDTFAEIASEIDDNAFQEFLSALNGS